MIREKFSIIPKAGLITTKKLNFQDFIIVLLLAAGVVLAIIQFIFNRSLWNDEASLALNIIEKSSQELFKPLDYQQVAPILFLQVEKLFSLIYPNSEMGLRFFPLICYLAALFTFLKLLRILLKNQVAIIFALSLFIFNPTIFYYSSEVKQYMGDVLVVIAIYYLLRKNYNTENTRLFALSIAGSVSIFLSNVTPIILFAVGTFLAYEYFFVSNRSVIPLLKPFGLWVSFFSVYYVYFVYQHPNRDYMIMFWSKLGTFMPANPFDASFYQFLNRFFHDVFNSLLPFGIAGTVLFTILLITGLAIKIKQKDMGFLVLTLLPIFLHLVLSSFQLYPVSPRLILYFTPLLILIVSSGLDGLIQKVHINISPYFWWSALMLILVFTGTQFFREGFPFQRREIKKSIDYIQQNMKPNHQLFVDRTADRVFRYYKSIGYYSAGVPEIYGFIQSEIRKKTKQPLTGKVWILSLGPKNHAFFRKQDIPEKYGFTIIEKYIAKGSNCYLIAFGNGIKQEYDSQDN